ncbi:serine/threonine-protein kinase [Candidatus Uabimicrobium sp. HlEnr_7]|uniref:serine/threonine-protein kinase n=1 Tax=Candidatus Uabimicrobium helgolandensis TaxID=3095367 RepID=UPI0035578D80
MTESLPDIELQNFEIIKLIGAGGAGSVYLAKQVNLNRLVAIKVIKKSREFSKDLVQRGLMEARILAKLHHPNIVSIYDVGEEETFFYMVIEYVDHGSLEEEIIKSKKVREQDVWRIARQVCHGLQAALSEGIIHRDIKPANILLSRQSGHKCAKVGDFGISKMAESTTSITKEGTILGTPSFISPETAQLGVNNFKSDIYSLGVTIYYCLTKKVIFEGGNILQILYNHVNEKVNAPVVHNSLLNPDANLIIAKMLQKKVENRYDSYGDLVVDIDNILHKKKPTFASLKDAERIYHKEQIRLFSSKTKRLSITKRLMKIAYTTGAVDNIAIIGMWNNELREENLHDRTAHFIESFTELEFFIQTYKDQINVVVIDLDYLAEKSIDVFTKLREKFGQTSVLLATDEKINVDEEKQKYFCTYNNLILRAGQSKNLPKIEEIDLSVIIKLAKEKSWSFELEIQEDETISRINIQHGDISNLEATRDISDVHELLIKRNTTWRVIKKLAAT